MLHLANLIPFCCLISSLLSAFSLAQDNATEISLNNQNNNTTLDKHPSPPAVPRSCEGDHYTISFYKQMKPEFTKASAIHFSTVDLPIAVAEEIPTPGFTYFYKQFDSGWSFYLSKFDYIDDALRCVQLTIKDDYADGDMVSSTRFHVLEKGAHGTGPLGGGFFGGDRPSPGVGTS